MRYEPKQVHAHTEQLGMNRNQQNLVQNLVANMNQPLSGLSAPPAPVCSDLVAERPHKMRKKIRFLQPEELQAAPP